MKLLTDLEFTRLGASLGFGAPPDYPSSDHWSCVTSDLDLSRYWSYPDETSAPAFARALLRVGGAAETYWIRPTRGRWFSPSHPGEGRSSQWNTRCASLGVPQDHSGAIGLATGDPRLEALITLQLVVGPSLMIDSLVLPSHGRHVWFFEHHDVVWGEFRDQATLLAHVKGLEAAGYSLAANPPDATFKPEPWQL